MARLVEHRHHQAAVEVLMTRLAQNGRLLQAPAHLGAGVDRGGRQPQAERAVCEAQAVLLDQLPAGDAAPPR
jgi:hypothetical protein